MGRLMDGPDSLADLANPASEACSYCGATRLGRYCSECGQAVRVGRLNVRELLASLPSRVFNLERGFLHTFVQLFKRPGGVAADYAAGLTRPYTNPFAYFFLAATIQLLSVIINEPIFLEMIRARQAAQGLDDPETAVTMFKTMQRVYTYAALLTFCLPYAIALRFIHRKLRPNFAETAVYSIYTVSHIVLLTGLVAPLTARFNPVMHGFVAPIFYFLMAAWSAPQFYGGSGRRFVWLTGPLAMLFGVAAFFVTLQIALVIALLRAG